MSLMPPTINLSVKLTLCLVSELVGCICRSGLAIGPAASEASGRNDVQQRRSDQRHDQAQHTL